MIKRFASMVLALVLCLSFAATAGASTVSDEVALSDTHDAASESGMFILTGDGSDAVLTDSDDLDQLSETVLGAEEGSTGMEQPDEPLGVDENGRDGTVIELHPVSTDVNEIDPDEPISTEDGNSINTNPEEGIEPTASTPEDYPITSFTTCWVSGQ